MPQEKQKQTLASVIEDAHRAITKMGLWVEWEGSKRPAEDPNVRAVKAIADVVRLRQHNLATLIWQAECAGRPTEELNAEYVTLLQIEGLMPKQYRWR